MASKVVSLAAAADGTAWYSDSSGQVWQRGGAWVLAPGNASQVTVGGKEHVWALNGGALFQFRSGGWLPLAQPPDVKIRQIDAGAGGFGMLVSDEGRLFRWTGGGWEADASASNVMRISVGSGGHIWCMTGDGAIYQRSANQWIRQPAPPGGAVKSLDVGSDGTVACAGGDGLLYRWSSTKWTADANARGVAGVAVGSAAHLYCFTENDAIYQWLNNGWIDTRRTG